MGLPKCFLPTPVKYSYDSHSAVIHWLSYWAHFKVKAIILLLVALACHICHPSLLHHNSSTQLSRVFYRYHLTNVHNQNQPVCAHFQLWAPILWNGFHSPGFPQTMHKGFSMQATRMCFNGTIQKNTLKE